MIDKIPYLFDCEAILLIIKGRVTPNTTKRHPASHIKSMIIMFDLTDANVGFLNTNDLPRDNVFIPVSSTNIPVAVFRPNEGTNSVFVFTQGNYARFAELALSSYSGEDKFHPNLKSKIIIDADYIVTEIVKKCRAGGVRLDVLNWHIRNDAYDVNASGKMNYDIPGDVIGLEKVKEIVGDVSFDGEIIIEAFSAIKFEYRDIELSIANTKSDDFVVMQNPLLYIKIKLIPVIEYVDGVMTVTITAFESRFIKEFIPSDERNDSTSEFLKSITAQEGIAEYANPIFQKIAELHYVRNNDIPIVSCEVGYEDMEYSYKTDIAIIGVRYKHTNRPLIFSAFEIKSPDGHTFYIMSRYDLKILKMLLSDGVHLLHTEINDDNRQSLFVSRNIDSVLSENEKGKTKGSYYMTWGDFVILDNPVFDITKREIINTGNMDLEMAFGRCRAVGETALNFVMRQVEGWHKYMKPLPVSGV